MKRSANVTSIDVLAEFKAAIEQYAADGRDTLTTLLLELRRAIEWIENDRTKYWPREVRRAADAVHEARNNLERCQLSIRPDEAPPCYEQKQALELAKRRLRTAEEKVDIVRGWRVKLHHESDEFKGQLGKMNHCLESDLARAVANLDRMMMALDKYAERKVGRDEEDEK